MKEVGLRYLKFSKYLLKIGIGSLILYLLSLLLPSHPIVKTLLGVLTLSSFGESILLKGMSIVILSRYKKGE